MRTYKLTIAYDGTRYQGWQRQPFTAMTVQEKLEEALAGAVGYDVKIHGSGRTDAGVHAKGQTAHMQAAGKLDEKRFVSEVNQRLPDDICIRQAELVRNSFHSRYKAKAKKYVYSLDMRERPDVFKRKYFYHFPGKLDIRAMEKAAGYLAGRHDFAAFTDLKTDKSTVRRIYGISIRQEGQKLFITYCGNGFLYHMVRILTGTLLEAGTGRRSPGRVKEALISGDRSKAGFLAPARGLTLLEVIY